MGERGLGSGRWAVRDICALLGRRPCQALTHPPARAPAPEYRGPPEPLQPIVSVKNDRNQEYGIHFLRIDAVLSKSTGILPHAVRIGPYSWVASIKILLNPTTRCQQISQIQTVLKSLMSIDASDSEVLITDITAGATLASLSIPRTKPACPNYSVYAYGIS